MTKESFDKEYTLDDTYSIGIVDTFERFLATKDIWDSLVEKQGSHEPFLCHDWFKIWLKHFLGDATLFILIMCRNNVPVLIAPLMRKKERYKRVAVVRKLN